VHQQSERNLLNSNISSMCLYNMVNFGPLTAEIGLPVRGTPANFSEFHVLASLLHQRRPMEVNQTLHSLWPSAGLVHYVYLFGGSCPLMEFCQLQNSLCVQSCILIYWQHYCTALRQQHGTRNRRGRHLYSGWAAITLGIGPHSSLFFILFVN